MTPTNRHLEEAERIWNEGDFGSDSIAVNSIAAALCNAEQDALRRAIEEVEKGIKLPTWPVPEMTSVLPDSPEVAADQCRIATKEQCLKILYSLIDAKE